MGNFYQIKVLIQIPFSSTGDVLQCVLEYNILLSYFPSVIEQNVMTMMAAKRVKQFYQIHFQKLLISSQSSRIAEFRRNGKRLVRLRKFGWKQTSRRASRSSKQIIYLCFFMVGKRQIQLFPNKYLKRIVNII